MGDSARQELNRDACVELSLPCPSGRADESELVWSQSPSEIAKTSPRGKWDA